MTEIQKFNRSPFVTMAGYEEFFKQLKKHEEHDEINRQQTDNKVVTNWQQTDNKVTTNRQQSDNIQDSNLGETGNKVATLSATKWQQSDNKVATKHTFSSLVGLQRSLVLFIYKECTIARAKVTKSLSLEYISSALNSPSGSIKTTLQRLEEKRIIERKEFKNGRGGWSKYTLPELTFQEILQYETDNKLTTNWQQSDNKVATQPATTAPVVSSSYINTTTNNLERIDLDELEELGLSRSHLLQVEREYQLNPSIALSPEEVQTSIYNLIFDLKHNKERLRFRNDPITVLISMLRKGKPYVSVTPGQYKTPRQEALDSYLSAKEQREQLEQETTEKLKNIEYDKWLKNLKEEDLLELYPESNLVDMPAKIRKTMQRKKAVEISRDYFNAEIWPIKKKEILNNM